MCVYNVMKIYFHIDFDVYTLPRPCITHIEWTLNDIYLKQIVSFVST